MNLVQLALRRPLTIVVLVLAVSLGAWVALQRMTRDIFPPLGVPTIYVAQPYGGMDPAQMEGYLTYYYEYHFLYITGIEHVESKSIQGASLMKLQFHPGTDMSQALSEVIGYVNRARAFIYTTGLSCADTGAALAALRLLSSPAGELLRARLRRAIDLLRLHHPSPIIPVILGTDRAALVASQALLNAGVYVPAIRPPTVPAGTARLRIALSAAHSDDMIARLKDALESLTTCERIGDAS